METERFGSIADRIYSCSCSHCPLSHRLDLPGYFPKFGTGSPADAVLAIVTMNPGPPDGAQRLLTRDNLSRQAMHRAYGDGLVRYHREARGGALDLPSTISSRTGLSWDQVYYTEVAKCVTTEDEKKDGTRARALRVCADQYLGEELRALPSLEVILCLGGDSFRAVSAILSRTRVGWETLKPAGVILVPHPAAFGQRFRRELPAILDRVGAALGHR